MAKGKVNAKKLVIPKGTITNTRLVIITCHSGTSVSEVIESLGYTVTQWDPIATAPG